MVSSHPSEDDLRQRAYALWQEDGCPQGNPEAFWHRARAELAGSETEIDTALEDSFPASDPPAHSGTTGPNSKV